MRVYRFGTFEVDVASGELRRQGLRVRLHPQPFQVLCLLLERPGQVLTREEISRELWPDGTFVDYEHGVNAAVNRLREALRDRAGAPQFVETLPKRGYRFVGQVETVGVEARRAGIAEGRVEAADEGSADAVGGAPDPAAADPEASPARESISPSRWLATANDLPRTSGSLARALFVALQGMYLIFYVCTLANLGEVWDLLGAMPRAVFWLATLSAGALIPLRIFLLCGALFRPPHMRKRFPQLWPVLLGADMLWALGPFLLTDHISFGLALACVAPLVYAPFAQRSLVLMGALGSQAD